MKDWKEGTKVRFSLPGGALAVIQNYAGEMFWNILTVPEQRELIAHQDDLVEGWKEQN